MMRIMGWGVKKKKPNNNGKRWMFTQKDPNAMDVDAMSIEERNELMKKGACFRYKKTGHLSKDCPTRNKTTGTTQEVQKRMTPKEMYKHIQSLTAQLNNKEKQNFSKKLKRRVFKKENQIDAGLSYSRYLICNCRWHLQQYIIHSLQNSYKREKCQNLSHDWWSRRSFYWFAKNSNKGNWIVP